jgi:hypothetical protein
VEQRLSFRRFIVCLLLAGLCACSLPQNPDYRSLFGKDWADAEAYERDNRQWMITIAEENGISYPLAVAVVFPELVRYSAIRNLMETSALKILYINLGDEYANFSVGRFQMKPSFAEWVLTTACDSSDINFAFALPCRDQFENEREFRKSVVSDLEEPKVQLQYVSTFIRICQAIYNTGDMDEKEKIKFFSTLYNSGPGKSEPEIRELAERKYYSTKLNGSVKYPYSEVSVFWYENVYLIENPGQ